MQPAIQLESAIINPQTAFAIPYPEILSNIQTGILTYNEKRILLALSQCGYQSGEFYPKQITLAEKAEISTATLNRNLNALEDKGFIVRQTPSLHERKMFRYSTRYFFLYHEIYSAAEKGGVRPERFLRAIEGGKTGQNEPEIMREDSLRDGLRDDVRDEQLNINNHITKKTTTPRPDPVPEREPDPSEDIVVVFSYKDKKPPQSDTAENSQKGAQEKVANPVIDELLEEVKPDVTRSPDLRGIIARGVKAHGPEYVRKCIHYVNERSTTCYAGYLNLTIRSNWAAEWVSPEEKRQAGIRAAQEEVRREQARLAQEQAEREKIERKRQERESCRTAFNALPEAGKETLRQEFFNSPDVNMFQKKEAKKRADISDSPSFLMWLVSYHSELRGKQPIECFKSC